MGQPHNGWFIMENPIYKWMMTGGYPYDPETTINGGFRWMFMCFFVDFSWFFNGFLGILWISDDQCGGFHTWGITKMVGKPQTKMDENRG